MPTTLWNEVKKCEVKKSRNGKVASGMESQRLLNTSVPSKILFLSPILPTSQGL